MSGIAGEMEKFIMTNIETTPTTHNGSLQAYQRLLSEIEAVPMEDLATINVDVPSAVATVQGSLPEMRALRQQIADELTRFDIERFDKLEDYAYALTHAHALYRAATAPVLPAVELAADLTEIRDKLYSDAMNLAQHGLVEGERLKQCKTAIGYKAVAMDVLTLTAVLQERWAEIQGKTPLQLTDIEQARVMADKLIVVVGLREQAPTALSDVVANRQRIYTLFVNTYEDARRAIQYLRVGKGDADEIAPSLYAGRGGVGRRKSDPPPADTTPPTPAPATSTAPAIPAGLLSTPITSTLPITSPFQA